MNTMSDPINFSIGFVLINNQDLGNYYSFKNSLDKYDSSNSDFFMKQLLEQYDSCTISSVEYTNFNIPYMEYCSNILYYHNTMLSRITNESKKGYIKDAKKSIIYYITKFQTERDNTGIYETNLLTAYFNIFHNFNDSIDCLTMNYYYFPDSISSLIDESINFRDTNSIVQIDDLFYLNRYNDNYSPNSPYFLLKPNEAINLLNKIELEKNEKLSKTNPYAIELIKKFLQKVKNSEAKLLIKLGE